MIFDQMVAMSYSIINKYKIHIHSCVKNET